MNGIDIFFGLNEIGCDLVQEAEFDCFHAQVIQKPCIQNGHHRKITAKKWLLIAAITALTLLLAGFTLYLYKLEHLVIPKSDAETGHPLAVSQNILSMQGYEGSPSYMALSEWLDFQTSYAYEHPDWKFNGNYQRPDDYYNYPSFTQEMVDKVDELCEKYGLHTIGKPIFLTNQVEMEEYGLAGILSQNASPRCLYGHVFQDGTFVASGELELSQDYGRIIQFQMQSIMKDAFYTVPLGLDDLSDFIQWNYKTKDGCTSLMALSSQAGLIFVEKEDRFISVIIDEVPSDDTVFVGLPKDMAFLEAVCDCFVF